MKKRPHLFLSALEMAEMHLPEFPRTRQGVRLRAETEGWPSRERRGRGGRSGVKVEYQVPDYLVDAVELRKAVQAAALRPVPNSRGGADQVVGDEATLVKTDALIGRSLGASEPLLSAVLDAMDRAAEVRSIALTSRQRAFVIVRTLHAFATPDAVLLGMWDLADVEQVVGALVTISTKRFAGPDPSGR